MNLYLAMYAAFAHEKADAIDGLSEFAAQHVQRINQADASPYAPRRPDRSDREIRPEIFVDRVGLVPPLDPASVIDSKARDLIELSARDQLFGSAPIPSDVLHRDRQSLATDLSTDLHAERARPEMIKHEAPSPGIELRLGFRVPSWRIWCGEPIPE